MLDEIKALAEEGASLIWLHEREKRPIEADWSEKPKMPWAQLDKTYRPGNNVGVRLGEPSRMDDGLYLHCIDVDIRDSKFIEVANAKLRELFPGVVFNFFPTVQSGSGGASRHYYFVAKRPYRSLKLAHSDEKVIGADKKEHWGFEVELFGTGKQTVLPPSIHPITGRRYKWLFEPDFVIGFPVIDTGLLDSFFEEDDEDYIGRDTSRLDLTLAEIVKRLDDLDINKWCEDRDGWMRLGMAFKHQFEGTEDEEAAFEAWCNYSKKSKKFDLKKQRTDWRSFKGKTADPFTMRSVLHFARLGRIIKAFSEDDESVGPEPAPSSFDSIPKHLLSIPGDLQGLVDYYNATASKPQPQFAVQAALAFGSVVLGRNHCTDRDNYTSVYLVNLGQTTSGKEHGKEVIEQTLTAAGLGDLIGPPRYTSDAGLMSSLLIRPRHVSICDEMGLYLSSARNSTDANKHEAQSALMEVFGRLDGTHVDKGYSTHGKSKKQIEAMKKRKVKRPALTILGMSTPLTFFGALGMGDVTSGFLNRLLVVSTPIGRQKSRHTRLTEPPQAVVQWAKEHAWPKTNDEDIGNIRAKNEPGWAPEPIELPFTEESRDVIDKMEDDALAEMDRLEQFGMADLFGRTCELAMRLSMIVARSERKNCIESRHIEWARDYAFFYQRQMADEARKRIGRSPMKSITDDVHAIIVRGGEEGATGREIIRASLPFENLNQRDRLEVFSRLETDWGVAHIDIKTKDGKPRLGRPRKAYVAQKYRN